MKTVIKSTISLLTVLILFATAIVPTVSADGLRLIGEATYRYWGFKVYSAKLYAPNDVKNLQEKLGSVRMKLALTYARPLASDDFIKSGEAFMKDNPDINFDTLKSSLLEMNTLYQDVKEGDTYTIDFEPGKGLSLYLNDVYKGTVKGDEFAKGYLGIWLSKYSLSESFTESLFGTTENS